jgi:hypothetical protein
MKNYLKHWRNKMTDWGAFKEAYDRGILPEDKKGLYEEATKRGLTTGDPVIEQKPPQTWLERTGSNLYKYITDPKKVGRLAFQTGGTIAGGIVGSAVPIYGNIAGGGLGYALGDQLADIVYGKEGKSGTGIGETIKGEVERYKKTPLVEKALATSIPPYGFVKSLIQSTPEQIGEQLIETGKKIGIGTAYSGLGTAMNVGGKALYGIESGMRELRKEGIKEAISKPMEKYALKKASEKISEAATKGPLPVTEQIEKNILASEQVEKGIPGLKFNIGQKGGDPNLLSLARQKGQEPGVGVSYANQSTMKQNESITQYIDYHIRRNGNVDDFIIQVQKVKDALERGTKTAVATGESEASKLTGRGGEEVGGKILEKLQSLRTVDAKRAEQLYKQVPDSLKIDTTSLWDKVDDLFGGFDALTQRLGATPTGTMSRIRQAMKPEEGLGSIAEKHGLDPKRIVDIRGKPVKISSELPPELTMKQIKDFRSQVGFAQRSAVASRDFELAYNLGKLKDGVNETLSVAANKGEGEGFKALKTATEFWKNEYVPKYRFSPTSKVLDISKSGEPMADALVAEKYFLPGTGRSEVVANNYKLLFGKDPEAKGLIKDYASQLLLKKARNPITGELESKNVKLWLDQYDTALRKYGLKDEFSSLQKSLGKANEAKGMEIQFNKSSLAKVLNVDPDNAINEVLMTGTGRKQSIVRLQEMVKLSEKDPTGAAKEGLRAGIGDHFKKSIQTTARDLAENRIESLAKMDKYMQSFKPAFQQSGLYTKEQIKSFENVHEAIQIIAKQQRPNPAFGGSPTFELFSRLGASGGSMVLGQYGAYMAFKSLINIAEKPVKDQINKAVARAVFDPRYADAISVLAYDIKKLPAQKALEKFNTRLGTLGLIVTTENIREE